MLDPSISFGGHLANDDGLIDVRRIGLDVGGKSASYLVFNLEGETLRLRVHWEEIGFAQRLSADNSRSPLHVPDKHRPIVFLIGGDLAVDGNKDDSHKCRFAIFKSRDCDIARYKLLKRFTGSAASLREDVLKFDWKDGGNLSGEISDRPRFDRFQFVPDIECIRRVDRAANRTGISDGEGTESTDFTYVAWRFLPRLIGIGATPISADINCVGSQRDDHNTGVTGGKKEKRPKGKPQYSRSNASIDRMTWTQESINLPFLNLEKDRAGVLLSQDAP